MASDTIIRIVAVAGIVMSNQPTCAQDQAVELHRFKLASDIRVVIAEVPGAPRQTMLTFLPASMINDDAGRGQWAHLLEHMIIRTTDPEALQAPGMEINGETTHEYLRMDTYAEKDHWKDALARHAKWLAAREFDAAALEREKKNIEIEEKSVAANGQTTKFALAAWNQIVLCGRGHAAVHGDVANVNVEDIQKYRDAKVKIDQSILIATIGPAPMEEVRQAIEMAFGGLPASPLNPPPQSQPAKIDFSAAHAGTWDIHARHAMWWWTLPDQEIDSMAACMSIAQAVNIAAMSPDLKPLVKHTLAIPNVNAANAERLLLIDCELQEKASPDEVWAKMKALLTDLGEGGKRQGMPAMMGKSIVMSLMPKPDFAVIRKQLNNAPQMQNLAEGVWLLGLMNLENGWNVKAEEATQALTELDKNALDRLMKAIDSTSPGKLVLETKAD